MKSWIKRNLRNIITTSFIIPILLVAFVSISHVTSFYGISNPFSWAIYLSVAIEIAAISALAGLSVRMGNFIYIPFGIVTLVQFIGNIFFSFSYIDETSQIFKDWMEMTGTLLEPIGIESNDFAAHKRILALFSGGMLPLISLTFAHMLVKFSDSFEDVKKEEIIAEKIDIDVISTEAGKLEAKIEEQRWVPTEEEMNKLSELLEKKAQEEIITTTTTEELIKLEQKLTEIQKQKFDSLIETEEETTTTTTTEEQIITTSTTIEPVTTTTTKNPLGENIKRLNYLSRDTNA